MNKKVKIKLSELKIQSFVTVLREEYESQLKGGQRWASCPSCPDECETGGISIPCGTNYCSIDIPCVTGLPCTQICS